MARKKTGFEAFMGEVEAESRRDGTADELAAYDEHFRLAAEVLKHRMKRGMTQQALAKASGVQQSEISRIERGQGNPTFRTLAALAHAMKLSVGFISPRTARG